MATREEMISFLKSQSGEQKKPSREEMISFLEKQKQPEPMIQENAMTSALTTINPVLGAISYFSNDKNKEKALKAAQAIDSVTGAPTRAAIGRLQDGGSLSDAGQAFSNQFAEPPEFAPTGKQIAQKAGIGETTLKDVFPNLTDEQIGNALSSINPAFKLAQFAKPTEITASGAAGLGVDVAADWTNLLPVVGQIKKGVEATELGSKAISKAGQVFDKAGELASKGAGEVGKRAVSVVFGPDMTTINRYVGGRAEQIKNASSVEEIKNMIDSTMSGFFDEVDNAKLNQEQAKEAFKMVESKIRDATQDANFKFRVDKADVNDALNKYELKIADETRNANYQYRVDKADASNALKESTSQSDQAYQAEVSRLKSVKSPVDLTNDVLTAIQDAKQRVIRGSEESYKILEQDPGSYSIRGAAPILRDAADKMNIVGFVPRGVEGSSQLGQVAAKSGPVTTQARAVQQELLALAKRIEETPESVSATEIKKILQEIDRSEMASYGQPGFDSRVSEAYKMVRGTIDDAIKAKNPAYKAKMAQVSADMDLMKRGIDRFGDQRTTASRLNSIGSNTAQADRELLNELGSASGFDFNGRVSEFISNQRLLGNQEALRAIQAQARAQSGVEKNAARLSELSRPEAPLKYVDESLKSKGLANNPEYNALKQKSAEMARPEYSKQFVESELNAQGLPKKLEETKKGLQSAEQNLGSASEKLAPFKTITPVNSENIIRSLMGPPGKRIETRRMIEQLSKVSEKDFLNIIDDARAAQQFSGEYRNGSRNVNLFSILGFFSGGFAGGSIGAAIGATVDKFGGKMAQSILDAALKIKGAPTVSKIKALKLAPQVETYLIRELGKGLSGPELWVAKGQDELIDKDSSLDPEYLERYKKSKDGRNDLIRAGEPSVSPGKRQEIIDKIKSSPEYKQFLKEKEKQAQGKEPDQAKAKPAIKFPLVVQKDGYTAVVRNADELSEAKSEGWA